MSLDRLNTSAAYEVIQWLSRKHRLARNGQSEARRFVSVCFGASDMSLSCKLCVRLCLVCVEEGFDGSVSDHVMSGRTKAYSTKLEMHHSAISTMSVSDRHLKPILFFTHGV